MQQKFNNFPENLVSSQNKLSPQTQKQSKNCTNSETKREVPATPAASFKTTLETIIIHEALKMNQYFNWTQHKTSKPNWPTKRIIHTKTSPLKRIK